MCAKLLSQPQRLGFELMLGLIISLILYRFGDFTSILIKFVCFILG